MNILFFQEMQKELDEITAKRQKRGKKDEEKTVEEKSTLHVSNPLDYQVCIKCCLRYRMNVCGSDPPLLWGGGNYRENPFSVLLNAKWNKYI